MHPPVRLAPARPVRGALARRRLSSRRGQSRSGPLPDIARRDSILAAAPQRRLAHWRSRAAATWPGGSRSLPARACNVSSVVEPAATGAVQQPGAASDGDGKRPAPEARGTPAPSSPAPAPGLTSDGGQRGQAGAGGVEPLADAPASSAARCRGKPVRRRRAAAATACQSTGWRCPDWLAAPARSTAAASADPPPSPGSDREGLFELRARRAAAEARRPPKARKARAIRFSPRIGAKRAR